jgi:hypothetical protein
LLQPHPLEPLRLAGANYALEIKKEVKFLPSPLLEIHMATRKNTPTIEPEKVEEPIAEIPIAEEITGDEPTLEQRIEALEAHNKELELRIIELEKHKHSDHTIGTEALDQIRTYVIGRVNAHLRTSLGFSGTPSA